MANIYEISNNIQMLLESIEDIENPVSDECIADTLEALDGELEKKINNWCRAIRNITYEIENIKAEIMRLNNIKNAKEKEIERMKSILCNVLTKLGYEKYKTSEYSLYGFKSDKLDVTDKKLVPDEFKKERISLEIDNAKIKAALNKGQELPFARFTTSLTIGNRYRNKAEECNGNRS